MTKSPTEQWRDGNLPNGDYYIKVRGNLSKKDFFTYDNCINGKWAFTDDGNIIDIIASVPSYDEYKELVRKADKLEEQLEIAKEALEYYADETDWMGTTLNNSVGYYEKAFLEDNGYEVAQKALKEMEGVK